MFIFTVNHLSLQQNTRLNTFHKLLCKAGVEAKAVFLVWAK